MQRLLEKKVHNSDDLDVTRGYSNYQDVVDLVNALYDGLQPIGALERIPDDKLFFDDRIKRTVENFVENAEFLSLIRTKPRVDARGRGPKKLGDIIKENLDQLNLTDLTDESDFAELINKSIN